MALLTDAQLNTIAERLKLRPDYLGASDEDRMLLHIRQLTTERNALRYFVTIANNTIGDLTRERDELRAEVKTLKDKVT